MKKGKLTGKQKALIALIAAVCVCVAGVLILRFALPKEKEEPVQETTKETTVPSAPAEPEKTYKKIDWAALTALNPDIYAWITVPGTTVDYPVFQSSDAEPEDYYLTHNFDHSEGFPGTVYAQKRNAKDFSDRMTVLYGHNLKDKTMFTSLHRYESADFMKQNPYIYISTPEKDSVYRVIAAYNYDDRLILDYFDDFRDDNVWKTYLGSFDEITNGNVDLPRELVPEDRILTLSTCNNNPSQRFLVQSVLMSDAEIEEAGLTETVQQMEEAAADSAEALTGGTGSGTAEDGTAAGTPAEGTAAAQ